MELSQTIYALGNRVQTCHVNESEARHLTGIKYNMPAVMIEQATTVTGRWVSAVRIAPTVALPRYRHDVDNFTNYFQRYSTLSRTPRKARIRYDKTRPRPALDSTAEKHVRVNRPRVQTLITRYMLTVTRYLAWANAKCRQTTALMTGTHTNTHNCHSM